MKWKLAASIIILIPSLGLAAVLPIEVRDPSQVISKCEDAFDQIYDQRKAIEKTEDFACIEVIPSSDIATMKKGFMVSCEATAQDRLKYAYGSVVTIEVAVLMEPFNREYTPVVELRCAKNEATRISNYNATHSATGAGSAQGGDRGMREGCFERKSCW